MPDYIAYESATPLYPFRYKGTAHRTDERGLKIVRADRKDFIAFLDKLPGLEKGGKYDPENPDKYKRKTDVGELEIDINTATRKELIDYVSKFAIVSKTISDADLQNKALTLLYMSKVDKDRMQAQKKAAEDFEKHGKD